MKNRHVLPFFQIIDFPEGGKKMNALWLLIPEEAMILVPVGLGFLVMLGLISGGRAAGLLLLFVLLMALAPFVESLMDTLPLWLLLLMLAVFGFSMLRAAASLTLGRGVADNFLGMLVFAVFMAPFRMLRRMIQILFRGGGSA
jgi:hypothetical protein